MTFGLIKLSQYFKVCGVKKWREISLMTLL